MAGDGGSNEIIVKLRMDMAGGAKAVTDKIKKDAQSAGKEFGKNFGKGFAGFGGLGDAIAKQQAAAAKLAAKEQEKAQRATIAFDRKRAAEGVKTEKAKATAAAREHRLEERRQTALFKTQETNQRKFDRLEQTHLKEQERVATRAARTAAQYAGAEFTGSDGYLRAQGKMGARRAALRKEGRETEKARALAADPWWTQPDARASLKESRHLGRRAEFNAANGLDANGRVPPPPDKGRDDEAMKKVQDNPVFRVAKWLTMGGTAIVAAKMARGVGMNRAHSAAGMQLAGLEDYDPAVHNIYSSRYRTAANMGRSPAEYLEARAAGLRSTGGAIGGNQMLALRGTTGWSTGQAEQIAASSRNRGQNAQHDINEMFGIAIGAGYKEAARRPAFVQAFAEFMNKAHSYGGTTAGMGQVVSTISNRGGAVAEQYAIGVTSQLQAGLTGSDPMSSHAAFGRLLTGYGKPGSGMGFFQAEAKRRKGLSDPNMLPQILNQLREMTFGDEGAMAYQLVNQFGVSQAEAERLVGIKGLSGNGDAGNMFSPGRAANLTPQKAARYANRDVTTMQSTVKLTDSLDKLDDAAVSVAAEFEDLAKVVVNTMAALMRLFGKDKAGGAGQAPPMPSEPSTEGKTPEQIYTAVKAYREALKARATSRQSSPVQASEAEDALSASEYIKQKAKIGMLKASVPEGTTAIPDEVYAAAANMPMKQALQHMRGAVNALERGVNAQDVANGDFKLPRSGKKK